jgi:hypothetical protein
MVSVLLSLHAFLDWPGNYMEQANQAGELASFWVVGLIAGRLKEYTLLLADRFGIAEAAKKEIGFGALLGRRPPDACDADHMAFEQWRPGPWFQCRPGEMVLIPL